MTEAIKQWIADQGEENGEWIRKVHEYHTGEDFSNGLTKGIEIAEGFAEWVDDNYMQEEKGLWYAFGTLPNEPIVLLTTSQLLEKYLEYLSSINKEK